MGDTDIASRVALLCKLTSEEFVEFGTENTVSDELPLLADLRVRHLKGYQSVNAREQIDQRDGKSSSRRYGTTENSDLL